MDRTQQLIHCFYAMVVYCLVACKDSFYADHVLTPDYWPTDGWQQATPESQGVDSFALVELIEHARAEKVGVHNLLIIRHGYLIFATRSSRGRTHLRFAHASKAVG